MEGYRFTSRIRMALARAREEASRMRYDHVGTEHILLGLVADPASVCVALLRQQDMSVDEIRAQVEREAKPGGSSQPRPDLPYTSRSKRVLEFAMSEAREMGDGYVDTGHLLLALSRDKRDLGAHVLNTQGFSRDAARDALRALHAAGSEDPGGAVPQALAVLPPEQAARMLDRIARAERYAPVFKAHGIDVDKLIADIRGTK